MKNKRIYLTQIIKKELPYFIFAILCAFFLFFAGIKVYSEESLKNISDQVFRFHVLANSDSEDDQALKIKVRDAILKEMNTELSASHSKAETEKILRKNLDRVTKCAERTIKENGYTYEVKVEISRERFPEKKYGDISLPAGEYDALRILIGNAKGHNWWCVMYPPLCFVDTSCTIKETDKAKLRENLSDEDYKLITDSDDISVKVKFKILELFS